MRYFSLEREEKLDEGLNVHQTPLRHLQSLVFSRYALYAPMPN